MIVAVSNATGETALSGGPDEYTGFANALDARSGTITLDVDADVTPYDRALSAIVIRERDLGAVTVSVESDQLIIAGSRRPLAVLADIVRDSAVSGDPDGHVHIEYFPGHEYLSEGSVPLVIADAVQR